MENIDKQLFEALKKFHNDKEFVVGVMSNATHEEDRKVIIEYLENGEDVTIENIILLSLHLCNARKDK